MKGAGQHARRFVCNNFLPKTVLCITSQKGAVDYMLISRLYSTLAVTTSDVCNGTVTICT